MAAITEDKACRRPGVTEGLYGCEGLVPFRRLEHCLPVLHNTRSDQMPRERLDDNATFLKRFRMIAPFLAGFDMQRHKLFLAGGAVSAMVMNDPVVNTWRVQRAFSDFDMFLVGHQSEGAACDAIQALSRHLREFAAEGELKVYRTMNCVTFCGKTKETDEDGSMSFTVQVILRMYSTIGEVIHGFDLGSSAVLWDGNSLRFTRLGLIAANHGLNILNMDVRRGSYETRIQRYFNRGFDLALPDLDVSKVQEKGALPYLVIHVDSDDSTTCRDCTVPIYYLGVVFPWDKKDEAKAESEYAGSGSPAYGDLEKIRRRNLKHANRETVNVDGLCAEAELVDGLDIFAIQPTISTLDEFVAITKKAVNDREQKISLKALKNLIGVDSAMVVTTLLLTGGYTDEILRNICVGRYEKIKPGVIPFRFMRVEENTALTGPFPRVLVDIAAWYGTALRQ
jgi:hypothetical protein